MSAPCVAQPSKRRGNAFGSPLAEDVNKALIAALAAVRTTRGCGGTISDSKVAVSLGDNGSMCLPSAAARRLTVEQATCENTWLIENMCDSFNLLLLSHKGRQNM